MSDIFISYASEDRAEIEKHAHALESQGWSVWWDRSISIGQSYSRVIEAALDESRCVIVIWSKISVKSEWVLAEVEEARSQEKLFPLNIDGSRPPLIYRTLQTADFSCWSNDTTTTVFKQLVADLKRKIGEPVFKKKEAGSVVKEETSNASNKSSQSTTSGSAAISNTEQTDSKETSGANTGSESVQILDDKEAPVVKADHRSEKQKKTTKSRNISSPAIPSKVAEISSAQKTDSNKKDSEKISIKPVIISDSEQTTKDEKKHKQAKWIAPILLLALLMGSALLLQQQSSDSNPSNNSYSDTVENSNVQKRMADLQEQINDSISKLGMLNQGAMNAMANIKGSIKEPEMLAIPKGCFQMGSPEPDPYRDDNERLHKVCVETFKIGKYEVSFDEYDQFCNATDCQKPDDKGWGRGNRPVINVSWEDTTAYAQWLASKTAKSYRLPTEAEWEYAARGNKQPQTRYPWGDNKGFNKANCNFCVSQWDLRKTAPVGSFAAHGFGLYDTVGNVWEWTCSLYKKDYDGSEKKCAEKRDSGQRVIRGGSWSDKSRYARSAHRYRYNPDYRANYIGFRLAQD